MKSLFEECLVQSRHPEQLVCGGRVLRWTLVLPTSAHALCNPSHVGWT